MYRCCAHMVKGGFVFGAEGGKGVATCRTDKGWSAPAFFTIGGGSWGLQIGVEGIDLVMIIRTITECSSCFPASSRSVATPPQQPASRPSRLRRHGLEAQHRDPHLLARQGIFAGLTLNGQVINRDNDAMDAFYGAGVSTSAVLHGEVPAPAAAMGFLHAVHKAKEQAMAQ